MVPPENGLPRIFTPVPNEHFLGMCRSCCPNTVADKKVSFVWKMSLRGIQIYTSNENCISCAHCFSIEAPSGAIPDMWVVSNGRTLYLRSRFILGQYATQGNVIKKDSMLYIIQESRIFIDMVLTIHLPLPPPRLLFAAQPHTPLIPCHAGQQLRGWSQNHQIQL